ncbi:MAG TPA: hypothetical protein VET65_05715 [Candidatus Limnocylindrales bacterium]|nr:hypothetical protein [Candidatus Limnocylindrales bacterium]
MPTQPLTKKVNLEKASLHVVDGEPEGGLKELKFRFNPTEYTISKSAEWSRKTNAAAPSCAPLHHFGGVHPATLQIEILFDRSEEEQESARDVSKDVHTLLTWTKPTPDTLKKGKKPWAPFLQFQWGSNKDTGFKCVLKSVTAKYLMFLRNGTPVRATASITLEEIPDDAKRQNPTSGALQTRSTHVVRDGDNLQLIAFEEYGDANLWRALASFNDLDDPLRVPAGRSLLVPTPAEARSLVLGEA